MARESEGAVGAERRATETKGEDAAPPKAPPNAPAATAPAAPSETSAHRYRVAPGKSITCARGVLGPGEEITADDLMGRATNAEKATDAERRAAANEQIANLHAHGHVVRG